MRGYVIAGAAAALVAALIWSHSAAYRYGRSTEQASFATRINEENEDAGNVAEEWRAELRRCGAAGGVFDFEAGACQR